MPAKYKDIVAQLDRDEIDYPELAKQLGADALPILLQVVQEGDPGRASKATYLASQIEGAAQNDVIAAAAQSEHPTIRVAAAGASRNLKTIPVEVLDSLLADNDSGVRKLAVRTAAESKVAGVRERLQIIATSDPHEHLRDAASKAVAKLK
jgi:glutamate-1-semialdehyde aminotransferase